MPPKQVAAIPATIVRLSPAADAVLSERGATLLRHSQPPVHLTRQEVQRLTDAWRTFCRPEQHDSGAP